MIKEIPYNHPLRTLFRSATKSAFRFNPKLQNEAIEQYISEWILARFVHADNIYKIRNARGKRLYDVAEMLVEGFLPGMKDTKMWEMAIYQHIGDYVLFITGIFPNSIGIISGRPSSRDYLITKIGSLYYSFTSLYDYYIHQGKTSYKKASEIIRGLNKDKPIVLQKLSSEFLAYVNVMSLIGLNLEASSYFQKYKGIISDN